MKVIKKQFNSRDCIICGIKNKLGIQAPFYEMEDGSVVSLFEYKLEHQSYPGRTHGGMITAMLDEIIGRVIWVTEPNTWGVTISLEMKFRKTVFYNTKLKAIGRITNITKRSFEGIGLLYDMEGNLLAEARAKYLKLPLSKIADGDIHKDMNVTIPDNVTEIDM